MAQDESSSGDAEEGPAGTEPSVSTDEPSPLGPARPGPGSRTLAGTGFFKPLKAADRMGRWYSTFGLMLGRRLALAVRDDHVYLILMAAVVGVTSGGAAALLLLWIERAHELFPNPQDNTSSLRWVVVIVVPVLGGLAAGGIAVLARRMLGYAPVSGVPGVIQALTNRGGDIRGWSPLATGLGTGMTIGSGGSVGHEGPSVAIGAGVGSILARFFGFQMRRHIALVGAGCAAGLAAAFDAPLAGVIFTVELVFGGSIGGTIGTMSVFIPLIVAAVAGTFTAHAIFGARPEFDLAPHTDFALPELVFYLLLAVVAGVVGALFSRLVLFTSRRFEASRIPLWLRPAAGGLGVGVLAVATMSNALLGTGRGTVDAALHSSLPWEAALWLLGLKMVATAMTLGSGGFGGIFMPSLFVGTCLGTVVGALSHVVLGSMVQDTGAYALVGMGAIFGAMMHAPLTPIVMIFELTRDYGIILPLMLSCILASLVARRIDADSFYRRVLRHRGVTPPQEAESEVMKRGQVVQLMRDPQRVLTPGATLDEVRSACLEAALASTYVVDEHGAVVGHIDGRLLARRMLRDEIEPDSTARDLMGSASLAYLYPHDTLAGAMLAFARSEQEILPVVDRERRLLGVIRRGDLIAHYSDNVLANQEEAVEVAAGGGWHGHQELGLGAGMILERVVVGRRWAGRTIAELDLRGRTGVTVLEWRRDSLILPVDPQKPLREGDVLALAGPREGILRTRAL